MSKKIGFIGCGNMGTAMMQGILDSGKCQPEEMMISCRTQATLDEKKAADKTEFRQLDLFTDFTGGNEKKQQDEKLEREKKMQEAVLSIKKKYGKNAILKGLNFQEGATTKARNEQIGGHKA